MLAKLDIAPPELHTLQSVQPIPQVLSEDDEHMLQAQVRTLIDTLNQLISYSSRSFAL